MALRRGLVLLGLLCALTSCGTTGPGWWSADISVDELDPSGPIDVSIDDIDPSGPVDVPEAIDSGLQGGESAAVTGTAPEDDPRSAEWFVAPIPSHDSTFGWAGAAAVGNIFHMDPEEPDSVPSTVAVGGFLSENDSWAAVLTGNLHLAGDRWRVATSAGYAQANYEFYGIGSDSGLRGISVPFETDYFGARLDVLRRTEWDALGWLGRGLFLGLLAEFSTLDTSVGSSRPLPSSLRPDVFDATRAILGLHVQRDTRDDRFFPREGSLFDARFELADAKWAADEEYHRIDLEHRSFHALGESTIFAWRGYLRWGNGGIPFYDLYSHDLRGYEGGRYRDEATAAGEMELRRHLWKRLYAVAFAGLGQVAPGVGRLSSDKLLWNAGLGLRVQLTQRNQLHYAVDVAWGRDDFEFYFSLGQAF